VYFVISASAKQIGLPLFIWKRGRGRAPGDNAVVKDYCEGFREQDDSLVSRKGPLLFMFL